MPPVQLCHDSPLCLALPSQIAPRPPRMCANTPFPVLVPVMPHEKHCHFSNSVSNSLFSKPRFKPTFPSVLLRMLPPAQHLNLEFMTFRFSFNVSSVLLPEGLSLFLVLNR